MAAAMCFWSCDPKEDLYDYKDKALTGTQVNVPENFNAKKVFVLNEGQMGSNNASLDVLRVSDGQYITGVWKKASPPALAMWPTTSSSSAMRFGLP